MPAFPKSKQQVLAVGDMQNHLIDFSGIYSGGAEVIKKMYWQAYKDGLCPVEQPGNFL